MNHKPLVGLWIILLDEYDFNKVIKKEKWFVIHLKVKLVVCYSDFFLTYKGLIWF